MWKLFEKEEEKIRKIISKKSDIFSPIKEEINKGLIDFDNFEHELNKECKEDISISNDNNNCLGKKRESFEKDKKEKPKRTTKDYYLKALLANFLNKYLFNTSNEKLKKLNKWLDKKSKIYRCNYKNIIRTSIEMNLEQFLSKTFKDIFKEKNKELFDNIERLLKNTEQYSKLIQETLDDFKEIYESEMESLLKDYYDSKEFESFKDKEKIKCYDYDFAHAPKRKHPSLLKLDGFIEYAKAKPYYHNKRKIRMNSIHSID